MSSIPTTNPLSCHSRRDTSPDPSWASRLRRILLFYSLRLECEFFANSSYSQFHSTYSQGCNHTPTDFQSIQSLLNATSSISKTTQPTWRRTTLMIHWAGPCFRFLRSQHLMAKMSGFIVISNARTTAAPASSTPFLIYPAPAPPAWYE